MESAQEAATALKFNRTIVAMARTVIAGMRTAGVGRYNGAHLRLEKDAVDWARILGGLPKYLAEYAKSFAAAGFSTAKDLYIASGLLSYDASDEMQNMLKFLRPHSKTVQVRGARGRGGAGGGARAFNPPGWERVEAWGAARGRRARGVQAACCVPTPSQSRPQGVDQLCSPRAPPPIPPPSYPAVQGALPAPSDAQGPQPGAGGAGRLSGAVQRKQLCGARVVNIQRVPQVRGRERARRRENARVARRPHSAARAHAAVLPQLPRHACCPPRSPWLCPRPTLTLALQGVPRAAGPRPAGGRVCGHIQDRDRRAV